MPNCQAGELIIGLLHKSIKFT